MGLSGRYDVTIELELIDFTFRKEKLAVFPICRSVYNAGKFSRAHTVMGIVSYTSCKGEKKVEFSLEG